MDVQVLHVYTALGWPLFPCSSQTKAPLTPHGFYDATIDWQQVLAWDEQFPGCAWGTPTSAERGVIDIDPRNGGNIALSQLIAEHGPLPRTPQVKTGGGGWHYWFRFPEGTKCGKPAPGIDRKAEGGYVIVPPSKIDMPEHEGRVYAWEVRPWEADLADAPAWALAQPEAKAQAKAKAQANPWIVRPAGDTLLSHPGSPEGERRKTLCRLVGAHLAKGDSPGTILVQDQPTFCSRGSSS